MAGLPAQGFLGTLLVDEIGIDGDIARLARHRLADPRDRGEIGHRLAVLAPVPDLAAPEPSFCNCCHIAA